MKVNSTNLMYLGGGVLAGGIAGYLIAEVVIYKKIESDFEKMVEEALNMPSKISWKHDPAVRAIEVGEEMRDYTQYSKDKESLSVLAGKYIPQVMEVVSASDWEENEMDFLKETVTYYTLDTVFADQDGDVIDNPNDVFGPNVHLHFGEESGDQDVVYIVDTGEKKMYEIIRIHSSYAHEILGEPLPAKPVSPKRSKRAAAKELKEDVDQESDDIS